MSYKRRRRKISTSKLEVLFEEKFLKPLNIKYSKQHKIKGKYYDFYIPSKKMVIEVDGDYYHGNKKTNNKLNEMQVKNKINDMYKDRKAIDMGYKVMRIWEYDIHNNPNKVFEKLIRHAI